MSVYQTSLTNRRATKKELEERYSGLLTICATMQPMTVRQVCYQATVQGLVDKSDAGYGQVQRALVDLRRSGRLPYSWIADNARWQRKPRSWRGGMPLVIHRTPLRWLQAGCEGCCLLKPGARHWLIKAGGPFVVFDVEHGR